MTTPRIGVRSTAAWWALPAFAGLTTTTSAALARWMCRAFVAYASVVGWTCSMVFAEAIVEFRDGDRIVLVGATFVERLQWHDYLETLITASYPDRNITFRNLGWSGDNVAGESRAVFGKPDDGFARLIKDVTEAKPTVIVVVYGANEAHAGPAGIDSFASGFRRLLESVVTTNARVILVASHRRESIPGRLPAQTTYNSYLYEYNRAIERLAQERGCEFVSLEELVGGETVRTIPLTREGLHLTEYGHWILAPQIAQRLRVPVAVSTTVIDAEKLTATGPKTSVRRVERIAGGIRFEMTATRLPYPRQIQDGAIVPTPAQITAIASSRLRVLRLPLGKYRLMSAGKPVTSYLDAQDWAQESGMAFANPSADEQWQQLQRTIHDKNVLYFHRFRPQNETYLFLFRKHEQGNNAVEIPQFDSLVETQEKRIAELRRPVAQEFQLLRE